MHSYKLISITCILELLETQIYSLVCPIYDISAFADDLYAATHSYTFSFSELKSLIDADNPDATRRRLAAAITRIIKDYFDRDPNLYKPF